MKYVEYPVEAAKRVVEKSYGCKPGDRKWITRRAGMYKGTQGPWLFRVYVLEGSPAKGWVVQPDADLECPVYAYNICGRLVGTFMGIVR